MTGMERVREELNKQMEKARWQGYICGKAQGALAVMDIIHLPQEEWVNILSDSISISTKTADQFVKEYLIAIDRID